MNLDEQHFNDQKSDRHPRLSKALRITLICSLLIALVVVLLWIFPRRISIDQTVNAVEVDANGTEIATLQIRIQGEILDYFFLDDRLAFTVDPFDDFTSIRASGNSGAVSKHEDLNTGKSYYLLHFLAGSASDNIANCMILLSAEYEYIAFHSSLSNGDSSTYVAADIDDNIKREIAEFFCSPA